MRKFGALPLILLIILLVAASQPYSQIHVPDNTQLSRYPAILGTTIIRDDFSSGFGAPPLLFKASAAVCTQNSGAGDGGACVSSSDNKSWVAVFPASPLDVRWWGKTYPIQQYASATGDASPDDYCLSNSTPCKSGDQALGKLIGFSLNGQTATIHYGAGTFNESPFCTGPLSGGIRGDVNQVSVLFTGADAIGSTVIAGNGATQWSVGFGAGCSIGIQNLKLTGTALAGQADLYGQFGGVGNVYDGVIFGPANAQQIITEGAGTQVQIWNSFTIAGNASYFGLAQHETLIELNPCNTCVVTLTGTPAFSAAFAGAAYQAHFSVQCCWSFSGSATGSEFAAVDNGSVFNASGNTLPGNAIGTKVRGGQYDPPVAPTLSSVTGLGTGGTATVDAGSGASSGWITLNTGSASTASSGSLVMTFNTEIEGSSAKPGPCGFYPYSFGSGWAATAGAFVNGFSTNSLTPFWNNAGTGLALNSTYKLSYTCRGSS